MDLYSIALVCLIVIGFLSYKLHVYLSKKEELVLFWAIKKNLNNRITTNPNPYTIVPSMVKEWILHEAIINKVQVKIIDHNCFVEFQISGCYATSSYYFVPTYHPDRKPSAYNELDVSELNDLNEYVNKALAFAVIYAAHLQLTNERDLTRADLDKVRDEVFQIFGDVVDVVVFDVGAKHSVIRVTDRDNYEISVEQLFPSVK